MSMSMSMAVTMTIGLALGLGGELLLLKIALQEVLHGQRSQLRGSTAGDLVGWRRSGLRGLQQVTVPNAVTPLKGRARLVLLVVMHVRVHGLLDEVHQEEAAAHEQLRQREGELANDAALLQLLHHLLDLGQQMQEGGGQQDAAAKVKQALDHDRRAGVRLVLRPAVAAVQQEGYGAADGAGAEENHHGGDLGHQHTAAILLLVIMIVIMIVIVIVIPVVMTRHPTAGGGLIDLKEALEKIIDLRLIHVGCRFRIRFALLVSFVLFCLAFQ